MAVDTLHHSSALQHSTENTFTNGFYFWSPSSSLSFLRCVSICLSSTMSETKDMRVQQITTEKVNSFRKKDNIYLTLELLHGFQSSKTFILTEFSNLIKKSIGAEPRWATPKKKKTFKQIKLFSFFLPFEVH